MDKDFEKRIEGFERAFNNHNAWYNHLTPEGLIHEVQHLIFSFRLEQMNTYYFLIFTQFCDSP